MLFFRFPGHRHGPSSMLALLQMREFWLEGWEIFKGWPCLDEGWPGKRFARGASLRRVGDMQSCWAAAGEHVLSRAGVPSFFNI